MHPGIARRLDGSALANEIRSDLLPRVAEFRAHAGRPPALHIVLAGDDPASRIYVRNKERAGAESGLSVTIHRLSADASRDQVLAIVRRLNDEAGCDGILVQSPLPAGMGKGATQQVFDVIDPEKDVDGFNPISVGRLVQGRAHLAPCTPSGIMEMLQRSDIPVSGRRAVVLGRSDIVGKPMAMLLLQHDATVTICHSRTRALAEIAAEADILVAALGRPGFVTPAFVKPGATVIDVGINRVTDRALALDLVGTSPRLAEFERRGAVIVGDVHPRVGEVAGALTPVPGGVGPLTVAMLLKNTVTAARARCGMEEQRRQTV